MNNLKLSISLVIYREKFSDIKACLVSLVHSIPGDIQYKIFIIDNGAIELSRTSDIEFQAKKNFPKLPIHYIVSPKNGGYGYGHNQAIFQSEANYHLILNNDVYMMFNALKNAINFMQQNPNVGMLVPDVYGMDGKRVYLCRHNPTLVINFLRRFSPVWLKKLCEKKLLYFEMRDKNYDEPIFNLTNPTGCFMFCRLDLLKSLKGFDEKLFMYYDDSDLGRRMAIISKIAYVPSVKIKHLWRRAAYHDKYMAWIAIKSAFYYAWKWSWLNNKKFINY